jgi:DNA-binding NarL/FixJ family response regulator
VDAGEAVLHPAIARKVVNRFSQPVGELAQESALEHLTGRETEVLRLAATGMTNRQIASELAISVRTVQVHLSNIFDKIGAGSRTEAVLHALRRGWFTLEDTVRENGGER